ncbi:uncharacterized protein LOC124122889 isoform X3 [Haliotis rufescens]|uniref:uncharacterized protein LOC124122889 isoform X3 n=1 Tax=Haliotis rufescens TaxID=6454 RepID=UPI00201F2481|nr:uncharacterized protein LOC124122889 isoform X3 [Haliotis rufescens]
MAWLAKRPETPQSGVLLQTEYNIQHRSDLLMEEHILNVRATQEDLRRALVDLENAKISDDLLAQKEVVQEIHNKSEQLTVALQVMQKLNQEVAYARTDLDNALYNGHGDINAARKRVIWLEDKMGALCGKQRLKSQPLLALTELPSPSDAGDRDSDDSERPQMSDAGSDQMDGHPLSVFNLHHHDITLRPFRTRYGQSASSEAGSLTAALKRAKALREVERRKMEIIRQATPEPLYKHKPIIFAESEESSTEESSDEEQSEDEASQPDSEGGASNSQASDLHSDKGGDSNSQASDQHCASSPTEAVPKVEQMPTFLTEVSTPKSKVTIATLHDEGEKPLTGEAQPGHSQDMAQEYWNSEHHRFELSEFAEVMRDVDPLSYHNVGLAVPGTFIDKEDSEFEELPWRPHRKGSDIKDVHRVALDKLATRIHGMQDKMYSAAMLSVNPTRRKADVPREVSFLQSLDSRLSSKGAPRNKASSDLTAAESPHPQTVDTVILPRIEEKRLGTSLSGRLVYYPKPIPPPDVLPITRTNQNKVYPKLTDLYVDPDTCQKEPAQRLVDQHNLMEETKLVLYHEKPKPKPSGPSIHERRFRRMLERDKTASSKTSAPFIIHVEGDQFRKKLKQTFSMAKAMAKLQGAISQWGQMKPKSRGKQYSGLRWERVKTIVHSNLVSPRAEERRDAAKQLGMLRCGDTMVFYALKERLHKDEDQRVQYESAKSLILIGCWEDEILQVLLKYLAIGNTEIRQDLIKTMINGKNVQYVDKNMPTFPELVKILSHFCRNPDPEDPISFEAAVLLGRLCVADANGKEKLKKALTESTDSHIKSKAVEILVKQLNCTDSSVITSVQDILATSIVWKHRELAAKLLISLGPGHPCVRDDYEKIYLLLERRLWDDPSKEVRTAAAKALTALRMFARACETIEKRLEDPEEEARAEAAIAVGTLGMKSEKLTRLMLEMLELDSSDYVRLMIVRSFAALRLIDRRVLRTLREREKQEGPLARESKKTLRVLEGIMSTGSRSATPKMLTPNNHHRRIPKLTV